MSFSSVSMKNLLFPWKLIYFRLKDGFWARGLHQAIKRSNNKTCLLGSCDCFRAFYLFLSCSFSFESSTELWVFGYIRWTLAVSNTQTYACIWVCESLTKTFAINDDVIDISIKKKP